MELKLRPVARLVKILGEHLIRDNTTGVMELIKNGYDADAAVVVVELRNLADSEKTEVVIQDDGNGMDEETITGPWSEPAHGGKELEKEALKKTRKGRLPLGEKGVGRFAAQRLGRYLELVTRPAGSKFEYHINLDWNKFDSTSLFIDEVSFPMEKKEPKVFDGTRHGTRLTIKNARTAWTRKDVANLQAHLMKLLSPSHIKKDFSVSLKCEEYPELEGLEASDILEKFQFKIECVVDSKGFAKYAFYDRKADGTLTKGPNGDNEINLWSNVTDEWQKYHPQCGQLRIIIHAWLKKAENLKQYKITKEQLDSMSGISIYRDGFRIIPYGDESDDWLGLDKRRVLRPGQTYDNDQVIGRVEISQEKNPGLIDKTSREGLRENQAYFDMRELVLGVVSLLETESMEQRAKMKKQSESKKDLEKQIRTLKRDIEDLKLSPRTESEPPQRLEQEEKKLHSLPEVKQKSAVVQVPVQRLDDLHNRTNEIEKITDDLLKELADTKEEKREAFLHLVGIGLAAERFAHEFDRSVGALSANLRRIEEIRPFDPNVKALRIIVDTLKNEVALMSVGRYVRRVPEPEGISVSDIIEVVLAAHIKEIQDYSIKIEKQLNPSFAVRMSRASLSQVIDNIVANAIYWLSGKSEENDRRLSIHVNTSEKSIVVSNNGPKIQPNVRKSIFTAPFITSKPDGRGLGMYISYEIMERNKGYIELLDEKSPNNRYQGVAFKINFGEQN